MAQLNIGPYSFTGPYDPRGGFPSLPGVYVPACQSSTSQYRLIDVGETEDFSARLPNHDRAMCWHGNASGPISLWLHVMTNSSAADRRLVESYVRTNYNPPCGER